MSTRNSLIFAFCSALALSLSGCAHGLAKSVHGYTVLEAPRPGGRAIEVEESRMVVLQFVFDTDYADRAYEALQRKCPQGEIVNVATKYSTDLGIFSYRNKVRITANCIEANPRPAGNPRRPKGA